jgi:phenylacetic acid degradation operon negative regulatory protein
MSAWDGELLRTPGTMALPTREEEAPPALSRRDAAGAPSARSLLFTVLGEFVLTGSGSAWTSSLIAVFGKLGVEEKAIRQALMRAAADGWLVSERDGRRTRWRLTDAARQLLTDGAERIYTFTGPAQQWDGRWLLVSARVPDTDRRTRHALRTRLAWAGFGSLAPGLWISTRPDREDEARRIIAEAGSAGPAHVFIATRSGPAGSGDVREMVSQAWDLAGIEQAYRNFVAQFSARRPASALAAQVQLVHAWRRFPAIDPALPRQLLPARWTGVAAAELFARLHAEQAPDGLREWAELES